MRLILALVLAGIVSQSCDAQLLQRWGRAQVSSSCPGGVCPTRQSFSRQVTREVSVNRGPVASGVDRSLIEQHNALHGGRASTWPGGTEESLRKHLERDHGVIVRAGSGTVSASRYPGSQFRVGSRDRDGAVIMSIGVSQAPIPRSVPVVSQSTFGL
jgi:hypothetical protein